MKIAIVHYWLVQMRGGEMVLESLCRLFPNADIYTHVYDPEAVTADISAHKVGTTFINRLPFAKKYYTKYLPLMPIALECLDLTDYDLVISSESGPAKGIIVSPSAVHVSYVHTPMRYIWDHYHQYAASAGFITRMVMPFIAHYLRMWDISTSTRVDGFIANSNHVARRIKKFYRRDSSVLFPPVNVESYSRVTDAEIGDYYLLAGELVEYKKPRLAIEAFNMLDKRLVVIGKGDMQSELKKIALPNIEFLGHVQIETLKHHMARCKALIYPGEEDFGIIPVEVMASGRPVICYGKGGVLDSVIDGKTGVYFENQSVDDLVNAVVKFEQINLCNDDIDAIVAHTYKFSEKIFHKGVIDTLESMGVFIHDTKLPCEESVFYDDNKHQMPRARVHEKSFDKAY